MDWIIRNYTVLVMGLVLSLFTVYWATLILPFSSLPSFQEYKKRYPQSVDKDGNVHCVHCNSDSIQLSWMFGPNASFGPKKHVCTRCGASLWKS